MTGHTWREVLRSLLSVNEGPWRWRAGAVAAISTGIPLLLMSLAGHQSLGLISSLGSFTALYAAHLNSGERSRSLVLIGLGIIGASLVGVAFAGSTWLTFLGVMVVAALACVLILGYRVGPPGPMAFILVNGVSAHLSSPLRLGGAGIDGGLVLLMVTAGVVSSLLVVAAPRLLPVVRRREGPPRTLTELYGPLSFDVVSRWVGLRVVFAVLVASLVSLPLGVTRGYWVVLTAVVILQASHRLPLTLTRASQRILGTLVGVVSFMLLTRLAPGGKWLAALVPGLVFMVELVVVKNYGLALVFITPLALIISTSNPAGNPLAIVGERVADTFLGAFIAVLVFFAAEWVRRRLLRESLPKPH